MGWWIAAAICAFFVKGVTGFANTLVFTSILSFTNNNINISPVELIIGYPTNALIAWRERKSISWKICLPLAGLVLLGNIPGVIFLKLADASAIKIVLGAVVILTGLEMVIREFYKKKFSKSKLLLAVIGVVAGTLCGMYGIGALLGAYLYRVTDDSHAFKGNLCMVFLFENSFRIILYSVWGIIGLESLKLAGMLLPFALGGLFLGMYCGKFISEKLARRFVAATLIISGIALIVKSI
ncbi:MAG TPA: sulfite exporter TauE/SafE family protein [Eubacteriales bacterium]|nr:sulfite exporter TauE/SafE family protein [Eubacteriales bacterium]